jgi:hypothetical protein
MIVMLAIPGGMAATGARAGVSVVWQAPSNKKSAKYARRIMSPPNCPEKDKKPVPARNKFCNLVM